MCECSLSVVNVCVYVQVLSVCFIAAAVRRAETPVLLPQLPAEHAADVRPAADRRRTVGVHAVGRVRKRRDVVAPTPQRRRRTRRPHADAESDNGLAAAGGAVTHRRERVETGDDEGNIAGLERLGTPCHSGNKLVRVQLLRRCKHDSARLRC